MYMDYYHLTDQPFQITCNPKFLWQGDKHKEALAMLRYGILDNRGFLLLTGDVGTGKTLLVNQLLTLLPENVVVANLSGPKLNRIDFFQMLAHSLELPSLFNNKAEFLLYFQDYLHSAAANGQQVLLIIDEAQAMDQAALENIRLLSNIELPDRKLINIFLIGQQELNHSLLLSENRALAQRITMRYHLEPLARNEVDLYIAHRLQVAGCMQKLFTEKAVTEIFKCTAGIPRLINVLCDHAMLTGSVLELAKLDAGIIEECAHELRIPDQQRNAANERSTFTTTSTGRSTAKNKARAVKADELLAAQSLNRRTGKPRFVKWVFAGAVQFAVILLVVLVIHLNGGTNTILASITKEIDAYQKQPHGNLPDPKAAIDTEKSHSEDDARIAKDKLFIQLSPTNQIAAHSLVALDRVAEELTNFPEQVVTVFGCAEKADSPNHRLPVQHQRANDVKSYLMGKGAFSYQIKVMNTDEHYGAAADGNTAGYHSVIEFHSNANFSYYNEDK